MAGPRNLPHPRKLYSSLREIASSQERTKAVAEFLRSCTGAKTVCLFLARAGELTLTVSSQEGDVTPELLAEVTRVWNQYLERQPEDQRTQTIELTAVEMLRVTQESMKWRSPQHEVFERRMLGVYRGPRWIPVGVAMLKVEEAGALTPIRQAHVEAVCNALLDSGDVTEGAEPAH
jgi:hypothetical protein